MGKTWLIASGKGGVGKSTLVSGIGQALAAMNHRVCIVDADIGLRDQDAILGLQNRVVYDILDVIEKKCALEQALIQSLYDTDLYLLPAAQFARCSDMKKDAFAKLMLQLRQDFDAVLIDAPAGIERGLRGLLRAELDEVILICTPDDVCMRDVERTAILLSQHGKPRPQLIVNRLDEDLIRSGEMYKASVVAETLDLGMLGEVIDDIDAYRASLAHRSPMEVECEFSDAVERIARRMCGEEVKLPAYGTQPAKWYMRLFHRKPDRLIYKGGENA